MFNSQITITATIFNDDSIFAIITDFDVKIFKNGTEYNFESTPFVQIRDKKTRTFIDDNGAAVELTTDEQIALYNTICNMGD